jgi:carboxyl-terminal processing protease
LPVSVQQVVMVWFWAMILGLMVARAEEPAALQQAVSLIQEKLPGQLGDEQLLLAALQGITEHLNQQLGAPVNGVLTADGHAAFSAYLRGEREGLGALYQIVPGQGLLLDHVFADGPAARAGLVRGDLIVAINNHPFTGLSDDDIFQTASAGAMLPSIALDVRRPAGPRRFEILRGAYRVPSVSAHPTQANCVELLFFGEGAAADLRRQISGMDPAAGLLLDMRDNQGGMLSEAVAAAGLFLEAGAVVVIQRSADGAEEPQVAPGERTWSGQIALLVNERTAGAAEAFAAALREHRVADISGTQTAGHAREPSYYPIDGGLVLQLADTILRAPSGQSWDGVGLVPDLWVEPVTNSPSGILPDVQLSTARGLLQQP